LCIAVDAQSPARELEVAEIATRQHGVIAVWQLRALGIGRGVIQRWLALGRLHRVHRGVYAVGHRRLNIRGRWMAAVLACGRDALLSHRPAAALWELLPAGGARIDVTVVASSRAQRRGIALHQVRHLHPEDRTVIDAIPVTSLARTLLDVAETTRALERAWDTAERLRLLDVRAVEEMCRRSPGRHGLKSVGALLRDRTRRVPDTKRELEARFFDFCRAHGLPLPACNVLVEGYEVDAYWAEQRLIVELDSWEFHHDRRAFERDRERDAVLQAAGYRVIRITWRRLTNHPEAVASLLRALL
jgi:predicted transcriptional regulator of viral defense system